MEILFNDFKRQYSSIKEEMDTAIHEVLNSWWFILWKQVSSFEEEFAQKNWSKYCVWVWNWLDALKISLMALWVGEGDEVITTSHSAVATTLAILDVWAIPVFVDTDEYYCLDSALVEEKITEKTKAIIPVHIYGHSCDIAEIKRICDKHHLYLVEDCAQSHFTEFNWIKLGNYWDTWCFSFYPTKNLWAYGDAWAIVTNDEEIYKKCKMIRNYGQETRYEHKLFWVNSRLDEMQATILRIQLKHIDENTEKRKHVAKRYMDGLKWISQIELPEIRKWSTHTFHLFVIQCEKRDELMKYLKEKWIPTLIHYPISIHKQPFFDGKYSDIELPNLDKQVQKILSLPVHPFMTDEEIEYIVLNIKEFYGN